MILISVAGRRVAQSTDAASAAYSARRGAERPRRLARHPVGWALKALAQASKPPRRQPRPPPESPSAPVPPPVPAAVLPSVDVGAACVRAARCAGATSCHLRKARCAPRLFAAPLAPQRAQPSSNRCTCPPGANPPPDAPRGEARRGVPTLSRSDEGRAVRRRSPSCSASRCWFAPTPAVPIAAAKHQRGRRGHTRSLADRWAPPWPE